MPGDCAARLLPSLIGRQEGRDGGLNTSELTPSGQQVLHVRLKQSLAAVLCGNSPSAIWGSKIWHEIRIFELHLLCKVQVRGLIREGK